VERLVLSGAELLGDDEVAVLGPFEAAAVRDVQGIRLNLEAGD
jgi:hypothetical protein